MAKAAIKRKIVTRVNMSDVADSVNDRYQITDTCPAETVPYADAVKSQIREEQKKFAGQGLNTLPTVDLTGPAAQDPIGFSPETTQRILPTPPMTLLVISNENKTPQEQEAHTLVGVENESVQNLEANVSESQNTESIDISISRPPDGLTDTNTDSNSDRNNEGPITLRAKGGSDGHGDRLQGGMGNRVEAIEGNQSSTRDDEGKREQFATQPVGYMSDMLKHSVLNGLKKPQVNANTEVTGDLRTVEITSVTGSASSEPTGLRTSPHRRLQLKVDGLVPTLLAKRPKRTGKKKIILDPPKIARNYRLTLEQSKMLNEMKGFYQTSRRRIKWSELVGLAIEDLFGLVESGENPVISKPKKDAVVVSRSKQGVVLTEDQRIKLDDIFLAVRDSGNKVDNSTLVGVAIEQLYSRHLGEGLPLRDNKA